MEERYAPQKQRGWWMLYVLNALALIVAGLSILDQALPVSEQEQAPYRQWAEVVIWEE